MSTFNKRNDHDNPLEKKCLEEEEESTLIVARDSQATYAAMPILPDLSYYEPPSRAEELWNRLEADTRWTNLAANRRDALQKWYVPSRQIRSHLIMLIVGMTASPGS